MLYGQWDEMERGRKGGSWKKLRGSLESSLPFLLFYSGLSKHRRIKLRERKLRERKLRKEEISELYYSGESRSNYLVMTMALSALQYIYMTYNRP